MGNTVMVLNGSPSFQDREVPPSLGGGVAVHNGRFDAQAPSDNAGADLKGMFEMF